MFLYILWTFYHIFKGTRNWISIPETEAFIFQFFLLSNNLPEEEKFYITDFHNILIRSKLNEQLELSDFHLPRIHNRIITIADKSHYKKTNQAIWNGGTWHRHTHLTDAVLNQRNVKSDWWGEKNHVIEKKYECFSASNNLSEFNIRVVPQ